MSFAILKIDRKISYEKYLSMFKLPNSCWMKNYRSRCCSSENLARNVQQFAKCSMFVTKKSTKWTRCFKKFWSKNIQIQQRYAKCGPRGKSGPPRYFIWPTENIFQPNQLVLNVKCKFQLLVFSKESPEVPKKI